MKLPKVLREFLAGIQDYINTEKELLRLKMVKTGSQAVATIFSFLFVIMLFLLVFGFAGIWLALWLSEIFGSFTTGFGLTAGFFALLLILAVVFRNSLLVKPLVNLLIAAFTKHDPQPESKE
jgi:ABC-type multidrug transport system fused ATPase/permease subunit